MVSLKSDKDKKTNSLLTKTQSLCDKIKSTPYLVRQSSSGTNKESVNATTGDRVVRNSNDVQSDSSGSEHNTTQHQIQSDKQSSRVDSRNSGFTSKVVKRDVTLVTCSDAFTCTEPKLLG